MTGYGGVNHHNDARYSHLAGANDNRTTINSKTSKFSA